MRGYFKQALGVPDEVWVAMLTRFRPPVGGADPFDLHFQIDTGTAHTMISYEAAQQMGVTPGIYDQADRAPGWSAYGDIPGAWFDVEFGIPAEELGRDPNAGLCLLKHRVIVHRWARAGRLLPSLLGRDVLQHFRLLIDRKVGVVEVAPLLTDGTRESNQ